MVAIDQISTQTMSSIVQPAIVLTFAVDAVHAYRSDARHVFSDPVVRALPSTHALWRLSGIGFLGGIDYVRHGSGRTGRLGSFNAILADPAIEPSARSAPQKTLADVRRMSRQYRDDRSACEVLWYNIAVSIGYRWWQRFLAWISTDTKN